MKGKRNQLKFAVPRSLEENSLPWLLFLHINLHGINIKKKHSSGTRCDRPILHSDNVPVLTLRDLSDHFDTECSISEDI